MLVIALKDIINASTAEERIKGDTLGVSYAHLLAIQLMEYKKRAEYYFNKNDHTKIGIGGPVCAILKHCKVDLENSATNNIGYRLMNFEYMRSTDMVHHRATADIPLYKFKQPEPIAYILLPRPNLTSITVGHNAAFNVAPEDLANPQEFNLPKLPKTKALIRRIAIIPRQRRAAVQQGAAEVQGDPPMIQAAEAIEAGAANQPGLEVRQPEEVQQLEQQRQPEEQGEKEKEPEVDKTVEEGRNEEVIIIEDDQEQGLLPTEGDNTEEATETQQESEKGEDQGDIQMADNDDEQDNLTLEEMVKQLKAARLPQKGEQCTNAPTSVREQVEAAPTNAEIRQIEETSTLDPRAGETEVNDPRIATDMELCVPTGQNEEDQVAATNAESQQDQRTPDASEQATSQEPEIHRPAEIKDELARKRIEKLKAKVAKLKESNKTNRALIRDLMNRVQQLEERPNTNAPTTQQHNTTPSTHQEQETALVIHQTATLTHPGGAQKRKERSEEEQTETDFTTAVEIYEEEQLLHQAPKRLKQHDVVELNNSDSSQEEGLKPEDDPSKYPIFPNLIVGTNPNAETAESSWAESRMIKLKLPGSVRPGSPGTLPDLIPVNAYWQDVIAPATAEKPFLKMVEYAKLHAAERIPPEVYYEHKVLKKALHKLKQGKPSEWFNDSDPASP